MYSLNLELKSTIVYEIEHVFGRRIVSSRDCIELSEEIYRKTMHQLNPNTLRRFFSLVKAPYPPSQSTLTILSKYCGFQSIDDIYKIKNTEAFETGTLNPDTVLHFFVSLFQDTVIKENQDNTFMNMVMHSIKFLNANKFLTDRFQSMIAKTAHGKNYYFEQLVNIDKLNSFYGNGLRYYDKETGTTEASIFTSSLYVLKYWLSGEDAKLVKSAERLLSNEAIGKLNPLVNARRLAGILFYNEITKIDNEQNRIDIHNAYSDLASNAVNHKNLHTFSYIIAEALLLTGYPGDALFYLEHTKKMNINQSDRHAALDYEHLYMLIEAYALFNQKFFKKASLVFEKIKSSEFPFLSRRFSCILYLSLFRKMKPKEKGNKYEGQFASMIEETGFKRLLDI